MPLPRSASPCGSLIFFSRLTHFPFIVKKLTVVRVKFDFLLLKNYGEYAINKGLEEYFMR
ncbi:MAG: hypothetical protein DRH04_02400 [Deltaproteobacteria bacterium]|nr:MAG: hypothetical protein DRH04_02400 [Deltaproteobacteria bacterium]